jgi:hypothetical protein
MKSPLRIIAAGFFMGYRVRRISFHNLNKRDKHMKLFSLTSSCTLLVASQLSLAHEGHGPDMAELKKQAQKGEICIANKHGHSLGAFIEHEGKIFRCVKAWKENMAEQKELVWVELVMKDEKLVTVP